MRHVAYSLVGIICLLAVFCALAGSTQASGMLASIGALALATLVTTGVAAPHGRRQETDAAGHDVSDAGGTDHHLSAP